MATRLKRTTSFAQIDPMTLKRVLTGITTTGSPHVGNYVGAIRPAIAASRTPGVESFFFLADLHALVKCDDPARVQRSTLEIAASWLALGLDPERVFFYRQSDIPEIPELTWLLTCVAPKGLLNRAHAYKAAVDANAETGEDADAGITMGLFSYPILMAADILAFRAHAVPVGRDQVQHLEMARDIAQRFNHLYGAGEELLVLPEARIDESTAVLPGLDGRKMSKSYDNTIPLWLDAAGLRKAILGIVTNSQAPGEPKDPDNSHLFTIYRAFATEAESAAMHSAYRSGIAWGDAKQALFERIDQELAPARTRYESLIAAPEQIEETLQRGAERARDRVRPLLAKLRHAVGLQSLANPIKESAEQQYWREALARISPPAVPTPARVSDPYQWTGGVKFAKPYYFDIWVSASDRFLSFEYATKRDAAAIVSRIRSQGAKVLSVDVQGDSVAGQHKIILRVDGKAEAWGGTSTLDGAERLRSVLFESFRLAQERAGAARASCRLFREKDGKFYVKFSASSGEALMVSVGYDTPQDARRVQDALLAADPRVLERDAIAAAPHQGQYRFELNLPADVSIGHGPLVATEWESRDALQRFAAALAALATARAEAASS
jgi:tryptophanyl-tRNA synthetase